MGKFLRAMEVAAAVFDEALTRERMEGYVVALKDIQTKNRPRAHGGQ